MSCSHEELLALLRPWTQALCDWDDVLMHTRQCDDVVWISMSHGDRGGFIPVIYEAIELLTLVGELDVGVWREAVQLIWERSPLQQDNTSQALRFGLDLSSCYSDGITVASYCDRVLSPGVTSTDYSNARTKLETLYNEKERAKGTIKCRTLVKIPVKVTRSHFERQGAEASMRQLWEIVERQAAIRQRNALTTRVWPPLMQIDFVSIGEHGVFMNAEAFEYATKIVAHGVRMRALSLHRVPFVEEKSLQYIQGLQLLMGATEHQGINMGVTRVTIPAKITKRMASAAYSALFKSESVVGVSVCCEKKQREDYFDDSHDLTWQWTALTLFTTHATQVFDDVKISVDNLDCGNISAMELVLNDPNPLRVIAESMFPGLHIESVGAKEATASNFRLSPPQANDQAVVDLGELTVDVIGRYQQTPSANGWYCVLLPGWGPAWVKQTDCSLSGTPVDTARVRAPSRIWLSSINARCMLPIASLLRCVGKDIRHLKLSSITFREPMDEWWLKNIVRACPQLESLTIEDGGCLTSLNSIAQWYEDGFTRVPSIHLGGVHLKETADAAHFFSKLANPSHPMARRLGHLTLQLDRMRLPFTAAVDALHEMLDNNANLQYFSLSVLYQTKLLKRDMPKTKDFLRHQGKVVGRPLVPRQKLAVLSLVTDSSPQTFPGASVLREVDSKALSKIFEFAAEPTNRIVMTRFAHVGRQPKPFPEY